MKVKQNLFLMDNNIVSGMWFYDMLFGLCLSLLLIVVVILILFLFVESFNKLKNIMWLEYIWTFIQMLIVVMISMPSFQLLYMMEMNGNSELSVNIIGNMWFWSYSIDGFDNVSFDSFTIPTEELNIGMFRMLEVDYPLVLQFDIWIKLNVTSMDTLHSWSLPSLMIKLDSIQMHFNMTEIMSSFVGSFYGSCSELCGNNHSFMSINVEFVNMLMFENWINKF